MWMPGRKAQTLKETSSVMGYQVKIPIFEGPLDLLLFLIQKDQIEIQDIPIARITGEYLAYLRLMRLLRLDVVADFLVMATTLMYIKSQMLLPHSIQEDDIFQEDPRRELANNLLEYRLFKMAAETLEEREQEATLFFTRPSEPQLAEGEEEQDLIEVSLFDLLAAFKDIVEKEPEVVTHEVLLEEITVKECFDYILDALTHKKRLPFVELIRSDPRKMAMVVTFLALLELIRAQLVSVKQQRAFGQLWVYKKAHAKVDRHPFRDTS
jgi:segregation and condensation protein A